MNDIDKVKQKLIKIRQRKKQKQNYNYTNVSILPTVYNDNDEPLITDLQPLTNLNHTTPELSGFYNPYNNGIYDNNVVSVVDNKPLLKDKPLDKDKTNIITSYLSSTYRYFFPVKEGATDSSPPPLDLTNLSFWQLPCDFLNTKFYDDLIDRILRACADYDKDGNEENLKNDRAIIQTTFNQMLMVILAYIMAINIYYFVFMYKWDCPRLGYLPGYGMFFGLGKEAKTAKAWNIIPEFFLRDIRKPVYYCSFIYTTLYPALFNLLGVSKYKRLCFIFIFLFTLCFVFITMKDIGLAAFSFVSSGKINPLVILIVLCSVFTGIFFTSQINEEAVLDKALADARVVPPCNVQTVSDNVLAFTKLQNGRRSKKNTPYYYSIKELLNSGDQDAIAEYTKLNSDLYATPIISPESGGGNIPTDMNIDSAMAVPPIDTSSIYYTLAQAGLGKFIIFVKGLIRIIIAMSLLPVAQIFVSFFFLYTTSGIGLIINEGLSFLSRVMAHMNDNNGETPEKGSQDFYSSINETPFFKWWVNELFLLSIYTIFIIVKFITILILPISQIHVKLAFGLILGIIAAVLVGGCQYKYVYRQVIMKPVDSIATVINHQIPEVVPTISSVPPKPEVQTLGVTSGVPTPEVQTPTGVIPSVPPKPEVQTLGVTSGVPTSAGVIPSVPPEVPAPEDNTRI